MRGGRRERQLRINIYEFVDGWERDRERERQKEKEKRRRRKNKVSSKGGVSKRTATERTAALPSLRTVSKDKKKDKKKFTKRTHMHTHMQTQKHSHAFLLFVPVRIAFVALC